MLTVDAVLHRLISENRGHAAMQAQLAATEFHTLADNCRRLVRDGVTTVEEAARTILSAE